MIIFGDMNHIIEYLIFILMMIILYFNPKTYDIVYSLLIKYLFDFSKLNKYYVQPEIQTISQWESETLSDINRVMLKIKEKDSYLAQYRKFKRSLAKLTYQIAFANNLFEKLRIYLHEWINSELYILQFSYLLFIVWRLLCHQGLYFFQY
eukprot:TRINITY_DN36429_c0_g1_i1.p1 TRINITY_DN36429_c0_g1~~TRINITY_DN36429_c0_g1_i1.p1  ORF type:complete len:150 (-),score=5.85 TRINITY_DN36429_c0_g1_i1:88-537(-)